MKTAEKTVAGRPGVFQIIQKQGQPTTKVIINKNAKKPNGMLMPGVGKMIGSITGHSQTLTVTVLNPSSVKIDNNLKKISCFGNRPMVQCNLTSWKCTICKFTNPTFIINEETSTKS